MSKWWLAALALALLLLGAASLLVLDHSRASARVGFVPEAETTPRTSDGIMAPSEEESTGSQRRTALTRRSVSSALEVLVLRANRRPFPFADVWAYRGDELLRAGETD